METLDAYDTCDTLHVAELRIMSQLAEDLLALVTYPRGALVEHLLQEVALNLIAPGVEDERNGL